MCNLRVVESKRSEDVDLYIVDFTAFQVTLCFPAFPVAIKVKDDLKRTVLANFMAAESASTFKRIMGRNRRPGLLQVLEGEFIDLDRWDGIDVVG